LEKPSKLYNRKCNFDNYDIQCDKTFTPFYKTRIKFTEGINEQKKIYVSKLFYEIKVVPFFRVSFKSLSQLEKKSHL